MGRTDRLDIQAPGIGGPPDSYYHQREDDEPPVDYTALRRAAAKARAEAIPALRKNADTVLQHAQAIATLMPKHALNAAEFRALSYAHALLRLDAAKTLAQVAEMEERQRKEAY